MNSFFIISSLHFVKMINLSLCFFLLHSCIGMSDSQIDYLDRMEKDGLTSKEIDFIFKLENAGYYRVDISPNNTVDLEISGKYSLKLSCPPDFIKSNSSGIKTISDSLANVIYSQVLSQEQMKYSESVEINILLDYVEIDDSLTTTTYSIDSLKKNVLNKKRTSGH